MEADDNVEAVTLTANLALTVLRTGIFVTVGVLGVHFAIFTLP